MILIIEVNTKTHNCGEVINHVSFVYRKTSTGNNCQKCFIGLMTWNSNSTATQQVLAPE